MAVAAAQEQLQGSSSEEEEDDFDDVEEGDDDDGIGEAEKRRSAVLARARLLVHKASILEKERNNSIRNAKDEDGTKPIPLGDIAGPTASVRSGSKRSKGSKTRQTKVGGHVKTESNFSRYRRQSAYSLADERKKEKVGAVEELVQSKKKVRSAPVQKTR